jgi:hypothetical protein
MVHKQTERDVNVSRRKCMPFLKDQKDWGIRLGLKVNDAHPSLHEHNVHDIETFSAVGGIGNPNRVNHS